MSFPTSGLKNRKPNEVHQERREEKATEALQSFSDDVADSKSVMPVIGGLIISDDMATIVECDLPQYQGVKVHIRTNNPASVLLRKPLLRFSNEYHALQDRVRAIVTEYSTKEERLPDLYFELQASLDELEMKERDEWAFKKAEWFSRIVRRIEPWNYGSISHYREDGEPVVEPIPAPSPSNPKSYLVLLDQHQILGDWIETVGYNQAIVQASLPFSAASKKRSSESTSQS